MWFITRLARLHRFRFTSSSLHVHVHLYVHIYIIYQQSLTKDGINTFAEPNLYTRTKLLSHYSCMQKWLSKFNELDRYVGHLMKQMVVVKTQVVFYFQFSMRFFCWFFIICIGPWHGTVGTITHQYVLSSTKQLNALL